MSLSEGLKRGGRFVWLLLLVALPVVIGGLLWVVGAMSVAFPDQLVVLHVTDAIGLFAQNPPWHPVAFLVLLMLDVVIVITCLRNQRVRKALFQWFPAFLLALTGFLVFGIAVPMIPTNHGLHPLLTGSIALICLLATRVLTYLEQEDLVPLKPRDDNGAPKAQSLVPVDEHANGTGAA